MIVQPGVMQRHDGFQFQIARVERSDPDYGQYPDNQKLVPYASQERIVHHGLSEGLRMETMQDYFEVIDPLPRHEPLEYRSEQASPTAHLERLAARLDRQGHARTAAFVRAKITELR